MYVFYTISELKNHLNDFLANNKMVGFVPTMGALHGGHVSLIKKAKEENDVVVCSIFVNPMQFNDKKDLEKYPRTLAPDLKMLEKAGCNIVFAPSEKEVYPTESKEIFDFGLLDKVMEGKQRPGHFNGVAIVVKRLFEIVQPTKAYFGQKDFQQLAIIKALVKKLNLPVEIISCPIIREEDGLAMSSRNTRLNPEERKKSALISQTLFKVKEMKKSPLEEINQFVKDAFSNEPSFQLEYFEIVNFETLLPVKEINAEENPVACIAVKVGDVRLIDNVILFN